MYVEGVLVLADQLRWALIFLAHRIDPASARGAQVRDLSV